MAAPRLKASSSMNRRGLRDIALRHAQDLAQELGLPDAAKLLDATLAEEKKTDVALTKLAESMVNQHAEAA